MTDNKMHHNSALLMIICSSLNIAGSAVLLLGFIFYPAIRQRSFYLTAWLELCQLSLSITVLIARIIPTTNREFSMCCSFLVNFFILASAMWSVVMSSRISFVVVHRNELLSHFSNKSSDMVIESRKRRNVLIHAGVWGISLTMSVIPWCLGTYSGISNAWFWFDKGHLAQISALVFYFIPMLAVFLVNGRNIYLLRTNLLYLDEERVTESGSGIPLAQQLHDLANMLVSYPIIFAVEFMLLAADQIARYALVESSVMTSVLIVVQQTQGFALAVYFLVTSANCKGFRTLVLCCKVHNQQDSLLQSLIDPITEQSDRRGNSWKSRQMIGDNQTIAPDSVDKVLSHCDSDKNNDTTTLALASPGDVSMEGSDASFRARFCASTPTGDFTPGLATPCTPWTTKPDSVYPYTSRAGVATADDAMGKDTTRSGCEGGQCDADNIYCTPGRKYALP